MFLGSNSRSRVLINLTCAHARWPNTYAIQPLRSLLHHQSWEHCLSILRWKMPFFLHCFLHSIVKHCGIPHLELASQSPWSCCAIIMSGPLPLVHSTHQQGQVFIHTPSPHSSLSSTATNHGGPSRNSFYWIFLSSLRQGSLAFVKYHRTQKNNLSQLWWVQLHITFMCGSSDHNRRHCAYWIMGITTNVKQRKTIICMVILYSSVTLGLGARWWIQSALHNDSSTGTCVCVCRWVCWQVCTVWWWSDVWVWWGHADCWLPRWHARHRCGIDKCHIHHSSFPSTCSQWCGILLDTIMIYFILLSLFIAIWPFYHEIQYLVCACDILA